VRIVERPPSVPPPGVGKSVQGPRIVMLLAMVAAVVLVVAIWGRLHVRGVDYDLDGGALATLIPPAPSLKPEPTPPVVSSNPAPVATITIPTVEDIIPPRPGRSTSTPTPPPPAAPPPAAPSPPPPAAPRVTTRQPDVATPPAPRPAPAPPPVAQPAPQPTPAPDAKPAAGTGNATRDAQRALDRGDTARAVELARQATSADPTNAEAWLTLGAAYEASGRASLARSAYQSCATRGKGERVGECRALAQ
jgi:hypothetical protein